MFTIYGNPPPIYDPKAGEVRQKNKTAPTTESESVSEEGFQERRRSADRRVNSVAWNLPERRKRGRRAVLLLNARSRQPEQLISVKGRNIDTSA